MRTLRRKSVSLLLLLPAAVLAPGAAPPPPPPNIVVIVLDDLGYADLGCYGGTDIPTPHIDRLAASGVRFTAGYVAASVCCPSRAAIMTGRYPQRFGHEFNGPTRPDNGYGPEDLGLPLEERTLADALGAAGYRTMAVGKWHLGEQPHFRPMQRGFDDFFGFLAGGRTYYPNPRSVSAGTRVRCGDSPVPERRLTYTTDDFTEQALSFIERRASAPFFLYLAFNAVHTPLELRPTDLPRILSLPEGPRRAYHGMLTAVDDDVGLLLAALERIGARENTLIFLVNDNGGAESNASSNGGLRGGKSSKWEGGIRVPFIVSWPARIPAGGTFDQPVSALDIFPTCAAAAGADRPAGKPLDGVDLLPFLTGRASGPPHDILFWRRGEAAAVRAGPWKLIRSEGNPLLLFDLRDDPGETRNLATAHADVADRLLTRLVDWEQELALPRWQNSQYADLNQYLTHQLEAPADAPPESAPSP